ncbi:hypothetical protein [Lysinibacillus fusiformis]
MKFKLTLQTGEKLELSTEEINSVNEFAQILGQLESGRFVIIGKTAISKDHVVTIQQVD